MSFTTRCPACGTMFRLAPDQLKMADGWVRCGHCADVFDATLYFQSLAAVAPPVAGHTRPVAETRLPVDLPAAPSGQEAGVPHRVTPPQANSERLNETAPASREWPAAREAPAGQVGADVGRSRVQPAARTNGAPQDPDADFQAHLQRFASKTSDTVNESVASTRAAGLPIHREDKRTKPKKPTQSPSVAKGEAPSDPEPGFVRQARRRAFWQSPGMRVLLSCFALLLALALLLQWALHERDTLAAWQPRLAPVLTQLCAPLGCEVAPVRRIESIVIDSSALVRRLGNFYSFDLVLKNTAPMALAVPALELSLTDARDAVIARRVFLPDELPVALAWLPAQNSVSISLRLSLAVDDAKPMAGYRVLVFYP